MSVALMSLALMSVAQKSGHLLDSLTSLFYQQFLGGQIKTPLFILLSPFVVFGFSKFIVRLIYFAKVLF